MASRVRGNVHARFRGGEKAEITSKLYLFLSQTAALKYAYIGGLCIAMSDDPESDTNTTYQPPPKKVESKPSNGSSIVDKCDDCGDGVTQKVADYSTKRFGKPLCMSCQEKRKQRVEIPF